MADPDTFTPLELGEDPEVGEEEGGDLGEYSRRIDVVSTRVQIHGHSYRERMWALRQAKSRIGSWELLYVVANRLYYSRAYTFLYFCMIFANVIALIWLLSSGLYAETRVLFAFEILTTTILAVEVIVKLLTQMKSYWSKPSNWFDFFVLMLCVASIAVFENRSMFPSQAEYVDSMMQSFLLISRYAMQALRLFALVRQHRRMAALTAGIGQNFVDDVDFALVDPDIDPVHQRGGLRKQDRQSSIVSTGSWSSAEGINLHALVADDYAVLQTNALDESANAKDGKLSLA